MTLQEKIIAELGVKPSIDPKEEIRVSVEGTLMPPVNIVKAMIILFIL